MGIVKRISASNFDQILFNNKLRTSPLPIPGTSTVSRFEVWYRLNSHHRFTVRTLLPVYEFQPVFIVRQMMVHTPDISGSVFHAGTASNAFIGIIFLSSHDLSIA